MFLDNIIVLIKHIKFIKMCIKKLSFRKNSSNMLCFKHYSKLKSKKSLIISQCFNYCITKRYNFCSFYRSLILIKLFCFFLFISFYIVFCFRKTYSNSYKLEFRQSRTQQNSFQMVN